MPGVLAVAGALAAVQLMSSRAPAPPHLLVTGLLVWEAWCGGRYRTSALIAALACPGLLLVGPLAMRRQVAPPRRIAGPAGACGALAVLQLCFAGGVARTAGLGAGIVRPVLVTVACLALLVLLGTPAFAGHRR